MATAVLPYALPMPLQITSGYVPHHKNFFCKIKRKERLMSRKTTLLLASAVALLIAAAVLLVIILSGRNTSDNPGITLPDGSSGSITVGKLTPANLNDPDTYLSFSITAENVVSMITGMTHPQEYMASFYSAVSYGDSENIVVSTVNVSGDLSRIDITQSKRPAYSYVLTSDNVYGWEKGSARWIQTPCADFTSDDFAHLPGYNDITGVSPELIVESGFKLLEKEISEENIWTIFIKFSDAYGLVHEYYFSIDNGLLVFAEIL